MYLLFQKNHINSRDDVFGVLVRAVKTTPLYQFVFITSEFMEIQYKSTCFCLLFNLSTELCVSIYTVKYMVVLMGYFHFFFMWKGICLSF